MRICMAAARSLYLSPQETRILELIFQSKSDKEIAQLLGLQFSTVRTYLDRMFRKAGAHDRKGLLMRILELVFEDCRKSGCPRNC